MEKKEKGVLPPGTYNAIRDLVMQQLLPVVHKWGRHFRHCCEGVMHEVTTSIVESQNSATKGNHSYSVKCQMTLDHSLETLTLFGRNYIDRKMQQSATKCSKTPLWTNTTAANFLTDYAHRIVLSNLGRADTYYMVRCSNTKWLVCSKVSINKLLSSNIGPNETCTKFVHIREVTLNTTANENICKLHCSCCFYTRVGLPCVHVLKICETVEPSMCKVRWWKVYHYSYLNDNDVTEEINNYLDEECSDPKAITVSREYIQECTSSLPAFGEGVTSEIYESMISIHNNITPVTYDGPYVSELKQQIVTVDDEMSHDHFSPDIDGRSDYYGLHSEVALSQEQRMLNDTQQRSGAMGQTSLQQNRYHRCMAAVNEVLKVCIESEENTSRFIEKVSELHNEMIQKLSIPGTGKTVTCCLPLESRLSSKRKKTLGYI